MVIDCNANRLAIYFFYDKDGIVDDYIPYMLNDLKKNVADIFVVCNGKLSESGRKKFENYTDKILVRDNKGFDVWAYKEAMEHIGYKTLSEYDEIILMNFTMMGPLYPLSDMFSEMSGRDVDFWGITQFFETEDDSFGTMPDGYIPDHIQSHFIAVRQSLVKERIFKDYWDKMPMITGYIDSISRHEARFTKYFENAGYKWDVYVDASDYRTLSHQPAVALAYRMVSEKKCPIFKRRSFMQDYNVVLNESCGQEAVELYKYLEKHTDFNMNFLWDNLLRVENMADLKKNLHWNYILSSTVPKNNIPPKGKKIALVMHIYFEDLIEECFIYACSMPDNTDIYITTDTDEKCLAIKEVFSAIKCGKLDVRTVSNRGRDIGPFLVEFRDFISEYDYICHAHDKKAGQASVGTIGTSFAYKCFQNILKSKEYVLNILDTFEKNERLGILAPPPPNHADYYITLGLEWGANYQNTVKLCKELGINVPMSPKKEPVAPLGSYYWARCDAIKPVFSKAWKYDDFPAEPVLDDGTILHAIERIYPFAAQSRGYYSGWVMCDEGAAIEITNLNHMIKEINNIIFFKGMDAGSYHETLMNLSKSYDYANEMKKINGNIDDKCAKLYYEYNDEGFSENKTLLKMPVKENDKYIYEFNFNSPQKVSMLRIDPCEYGNIIVGDFTAIVVDGKGISHKYTVSENSHNGIYDSGKIIFLMDDPWITINTGNIEDIKSVVCEMNIEKKQLGELMEIIHNKLTHKGLFHRIWRRITGNGY